MPEPSATAHRRLHPAGRDQASGNMQLVSIRKGAFLRLSDFVNEYDFPGFMYKPDDPFRQLHRQLRVDEGYPELVGSSDP